MQHDEHIPISEDVLTAEMLQEFFFGDYQQPTHPPSGVVLVGSTVHRGEKGGEEEDKKKQHQQQSTFCATAENLSTLRVSSYMEAHWLTLTIMQALPRPQKKPCR